MEDPGFWEWVKTPRSQGGGGLKSGDPIATQTAYNELMRQYLKSGGGFKPQIVEVPVPGTTNSERAFMTSPNSAQMMKEPQSRGRYEVQDGKLYLVDGTSAMAVTNVVGGSPFAPDPRTSGFDPAAIMGMMGPPPAAPRGFFGFGRQPEPTPTPMPSPTPMATPEQAAPGAAPLPGTNAPTPPRLGTPEEIRAAFQAGLISDEQAIRLLRGQP
jgi:hypothetical protein